MNPLLLNNIFYILETTAIFSFALSGMIAAKRKNFDPVGTYVIACVTAFGGGTLRDVILDVQPVYWISHPEYPAIIFLFIMFAYLFTFVFKGFHIKEKWLFIPDSVGISFFAITSAQTAISLGYPIIIVGIFSTMTACFGGVFCDILCLETPKIFNRGVSLYASAVFIGACLYFILHSFFGVSPEINMVVSSLATLSLRFLAVKFKWRLDF
ncbi:trimeric intracellular cation channel family protein [Candidatus Marinamargulisbacteria bacterium SCGC AAA071-K20]|nr:trimeric intracellular cation channel family protein [Candidatus Marinamargulisbacteria bacterium SCGC AAA071-K20]